MSLEKIVAIKDLSYRYPSARNWALKDINLEIDEGKYVGVVGSNGAGKTTLSLILNGLIPNALGGELKGKVTVCGMDTSKHKTPELAQKVGLVFSDPEAQLSQITVEEEVAFGPANLGVSKERIFENVRESIKVTGLQGLERRAPLTLSGGQKQRVAIAAVLAMNPSVLVLDEPTSNLDPLGTCEIFQTIKDIVEIRGITVVMAEHHTELLAEYADRIVTLDDGQVVADGHPQEVFGRCRDVEKMGIRVPQVTRTFELLEDDHGLCLGKYPVTLKTACDVLSRRLAKTAVSKPTTAFDTFGQKRGGDEAVIRVEDLHFWYPDNVYALKGVSLEVYKGEVLAIVGQNGSGKTTLAKHFNGLLKPSKGKVWVKGIDTSKSSVGDLSKLVGYVFQNPNHQLFNVTVFKEVAFGPRSFGLKGEELEHRVDEALHVFGIEDLKEENPFGLSLGQRKLVAIASVFAMHPEVVILDEPAMGQDYSGVKRISQVVKTLSENDCTVIVITHDMSFVAENTERVILMQDGRLLVGGDPRTVFDKASDKMSAFLQATNLRPPQVTELSYLLSSYGLSTNIMTPEEFAEIAAKRLI